MGVMRFQIHPRELLDGWPEVFRSYVSGADGRIFTTRIEVDGNIVACRRQASESGKLHVAWPVPGFGRPVISTTSLAEREEPYLLSVELARGKISQVRDQLGAWEIAGMSIPEEMLPYHQAAHRLFAKATAIQHVPDQACALAVEAIAKACQAAEVLAQSYTRQRLSVLRKRSHQLPASLGCNLGPAIPQSDWADRFCETFTVVEVPIEWRSIEPVEGEYHWDVSDAQVEWCQKKRNLIYAGPLLDLSPEGMPAWLWQWEHDFFNLQSFVCDFVETAISRYMGKIRHWEISARVNTGGALALSEEHRLALVARTLDVARQVDEELQLQIRIDQPWGDYQARGQHRLSPLQFVDALVRSGVGLSAVNLEISVGYRLRGSASRELLDFSRLIDQWSCLGIPLQVTLAVPSETSEDPNSNTDLEVDSGYWKNPWCEKVQAEWIDLYLPLLMAKQSVVGVFWAHFSDGLSHRFPHAGLLRSDHTPKPALEQFLKYRKAYGKKNDDAQDAAT